MKNNVDAELIKQIMDDKNLTQTKFGELIGKEKQYIWNIVNGKRNISKDIQNVIIQKFPEYFNEDTTVKIKCCPDIILPYVNSLNSKSNDYISFDKRLLPTINGRELHYDKCMIVTIGSDNLYPDFQNGSKVIIETGHKEFLNDYIYAFTFGNPCYIRRISLNPVTGQIKCISLNDKEDTFYISSLDDKTNILGVIIPRIRL